MQASVPTGGGGASAVSAQKDILQPGFSSDSPLCKAPSAPPSTPKTPGAAAETPKTPEGVQMEALTAMPAEVSLLHAFCSPHHTPFADLHSRAL